MRRAGSNILPFTKRSLTRVREGDLVSLSARATRLQYLNDGVGCGHQALGMAASVCVERDREQCLSPRAHHPRHPRLRLRRFDLNSQITRLNMKLHQGKSDGYCKEGTA